MPLDYPNAFEVVSGSLLAVSGTFSSNGRPTQVSFTGTAGQVSVDGRFTATAADGSYITVTLLSLP